MENLTTSRRLDSLGRPIKAPRFVSPRTTPEPPSVEGARWIALTKARFALVDDEDFQRFGSLVWSAMVMPRTTYAYIRRTDGIKSRIIFLHRLILDAPDGMQVDHINGDGLDCRRQNLRLCSIQQNHSNIRKRERPTSSRFKGVTWDKNRNMWMCKVKAHGRHLYLGRFDNEEDAARAYDRAAMKHFGEFARLNFPQDVK